MAKQWIKNSAVREMIDHVVTPNYRKGGITEGMVAYIENAETKAAGICLSLSVTKIRACEEHRRHVYRPRKKKS